MNLPILHHNAHYFSVPGFYDLVWIPTSSLLVCSVFDSIQIWKMSTDYTCINIIDGDTLDGDGVKSCCFAASDEMLFCGTDRGQIKIFDLMTGIIHDTFRKPGIGNVRNYICDIKVRGKDLIALDWLGSTETWKILANGRDVAFVSTFTPTSNDASLTSQYSMKQTERRIEFNDSIVVTNVRQIFCIWDLQNKSRHPVFINTQSYVLCSKVLDRFAFWGEQNGSVHQVHLPEQEGKVENIGFVQTAFKDSITSLSVTSNVAIFGDKNGEISCAKLPISDQNKFEFVLESGHDFGAFVWAVQVDGVRIFSGDSNAKMIIHDFWNFDEEQSVSRKTYRPVKKLKTDSS